MSDDPALGATLDERGGKDRGRPAPRWLGERYRVQRLLGRGGMGEVYLAVDEALVCEVALKTIVPELSGSSRGLTLLRDEVRLAQQITHPNVCRTYDLEEIDGHWLVKMEYVAGETLAARLARGPLPVPEAVRVAREVCAGLAAAHQRGIVHRDLKPHNVMLEAGTGRVVLMDFGIARSAALAGQSAESISGTPGYMAPEQRRGREVDARADLYSLGCVLHEMLAGTHRDEPPSATAPRVPASLRRLVARLVADEPARRPASAAEVAAALGAPARRRRALLAAGGAVVAGAAVAAAALAVARPAPKWQPRLRELPSYDETADAPRFSPDGTQLAYMSDREEPSQFRIYVEPVAGGASRAVTPRGLDAVSPAWTRDGALLFVDQPSGRAYRQPLAGGAPVPLAEQVAAVDDCHGELLLLHEPAGDCAGCQRLVLRGGDGGEREILRFGPNDWLRGVRCDRAGRQVVYALGLPQFGAGADLWVASLAGGRPRRLTNDGAVSSGAFTADGRAVVFSSKRSGVFSLWRLPVDGSAPPALMASGAGPFLAPDVAPDGRSLVFDVDQTFVQLFAQPLAGGPRRRLTARVQDLAQPIATPDGRAIVATAISASGRAQIVAIPLDGGEAVPLVEGTTPGLSPEGAEVVYSLPGTGHILAIPRTGAEPRWVTEVPGTVIGNIAVGPDGRLYLGIVRGEGREAWTAPLAGGAATRAAPAPWTRIEPAPAGGWSRAGRPSERGFRIRFLPPGAALDAPAAREIEICTSGAWAPDGKSYVYTSCEGRVHRLWVETGEDRELAVADPDGGLTISPDGQTLYTTQTVGRVQRELITNFGER